MEREKKGHSILFYFFYVFLMYQFNFLFVIIFCIYHKKMLLIFLKVSIFIILYKNIMV